MSPWPAEKISTVALRYIRSSSMDSGQWLYTRLGEWDSRISYEFHSAERPLVVIYMSPASWSVFTSRRIAGSLGSETFDVSPLDVTQHHWGNDPKGESGDPTGIATLELRDGRSVRFEFETGKAWMGPIYAMLFWWNKYPVLDNLV